MTYADPMISVITVVFNGEKHLEQTIQSVISQSYQNIEYIIIDGGSTDGTLDIIKRYEHVIDRWISEKDDGIYDAMNKGIKLATGDFIAFLNADDWYEPNALSEVAKIMEKNKDIDFFYGNIYFIKDNGEKTLWRGDKGAHGLGIPHPSCFVRTALMKSAPFDTSFKIAADAEMTLRLFKNYVKCYYMDIEIANFRDSGISSDFWKTQKESFFIGVKYFGVGSAVKSFLKKSIVTIMNNLWSKR